MTGRTFAHYASYKDSGIELIDRIPSQWSVARVKEKGTVHGRVGWKALKASEYVDEGYIFLSTPNIKNRDIDFVNVNYITEARYVESPEIMLREDDILLAKDGSTLGTVNIVESLPGAATVNSSIAVLRFDKTVFSKYIFYQIESEYIQDEIRRKKSGMGVPHLFQQDINNFVIILPPLPEQRAIAAYLDTRTANLDRQIELLTQKAAHHADLKQALINHTITHGLDPAAPMKDRGIEWIGEIPAHWEVERIGSIFDERREKVSDTDYPPLSVTMQGIVPQLDTAAKTDYNDNRKRVVVNDFVINSRSDRRGSSGLSPLDGSVSVINIVLTPHKKTLGKYYHFLFRSHCFTEEFYRVGRGIVADLWTTKSSVMRTIEVPFPPLPEQRAIAAYLDTKTAHIDRIIETIDAKIAALQELRQTLINDVVTGKIKVV